MPVRAFMMEQARLLPLLTCPCLLHKVPAALAALTQLTQLAYTRGFPVGGPGWERRLLAATVAPADLRALHLASVPNRGGASLSTLCTCTHLVQGCSCDVRSACLSVLMLFSAAALMPGSCNRTRRLLDSVCAGSLGLTRSLSSVVLRLHGTLTDRTVCGSSGRRASVFGSSAASGSPGGAAHRRPRRPRSGHCSGSAMSRARGAVHLDLNDVWHRLYHRSSLACCRATLA